MDTTDHDILYIKNIEKHPKHHSLELLRMFSLDLNTIIKACLIFMRVNFLIFMLPLFGDNITPIRVKLFLSFTLTICLFPLIQNFMSPTLPMTLYFLAKLVFKELLLGLLIGFSARMMFEGLIMAANLVGYQMGFATANLLFPGEDLQSSAFTSFHRALVMLIFLGLGFHHVFIHALAETFYWIPLGKGNFDLHVTQFTLKNSQEIFSTAMRFASPVLISLLFTTAALSILARVFPQMNIFTLSFPISFFVGLSVYMLGLPFFPSQVQNYFSEYSESIIQFIKTLRA